MWLPWELYLRSHTNLSFGSALKTSKNEFREEDTEQVKSSCLPTKVRFGCESSCLSSRDSSQRDDSVGQKSYLVLLLSPSEASSVEYSRMLFLVLITLLSSLENKSMVES